MHGPNTICPRNTDGRGIKKRKRRGNGGGAAEVSDFFIKNPNLKKTKNFRVAEEVTNRVSIRILNKKSKSDFLGGKGGGARLSDFFTKNSNLEHNIFGGGV